MGAFTQNIRYALRSFARAPGFTAVTLLTLALGIGGTTAIFSIVDGVLLRPLPYPQSDRLVHLLHTTPNDREAAFSPADYLDVQHDASLLAAVAAYREDIVDLTGRGEPVRVRGVQTTAAFFDVLGAPPIVGRTYHAGTDQPGAAIAVIGESLWRQQFGADQAVVGTTVRLNGAPTAIIGVVPASVTHPIKADVWLLSPREVPVSPIPIDDPIASRDVQYFSAIARLSPPATLGAVRTELQSIGDRIAAEFPNTNGGESFDASPLSDTLVADVRSGLLVLLAAVAFVLLIACANVAGLLMARGVARRREMAVRTAVGASRFHLVAQLLVESLLLSAAGGLAGVLAAGWALDGLVALAPDNIPRLDEVALDWRVAAFAFAATLLVGLLVGITPALQASSPEPTRDLKDGGRTGTARTGARSALVTAQVSLALVLLIGAGLMLTSLWRLRSVDPGFRTSALVAVELPLPQARYDEAGQRRFYRSVLEKLRARPMTARSAIQFPFPLRGSTASASFELVGRPSVNRSERPLAELNAISPGFLGTAGLRLVRGREFTDADGPDAPPVVLINETLAGRAFHDGEDPLGHQVDIGEPATIVGVVSDARRSSLDREPQPAIYMSFEQFTLPFMGVIVNSAGGAAAVAPAVRQAVAEIDPELPIGEVRTIEQIIDESTGQPRFRALLVAAFAGLALLLAGIGVYGLVSFSVTQRVPEIGLRLALGASPWQVFRLVIGQGLLLAGVGVAIGLGAAALAARVARGLLYHTSVIDPLVYLPLAGALLVIAALACYVPARRAMRVDPMTALRAD